MSFIVNSFQLPNALIDSGLIATMSPNELKCYLVVVRKTAGWHKEWDTIPTVQLMEVTGIKKRQTVYSCMEKLEEYRLIESDKTKGKPTKYRLKVVPTDGTRTKKSSTDEGYGVVPMKGTGSSTDEGYTSKDKAKDTLQNTEKNKQKKKSGFDRFIEAIELNFTPHKIRSYLNKVNKTKRVKEAFGEIKGNVDLIEKAANDYPAYVARNKNMASRLDAWLWAMIDGRLDEIEHIKNDHNEPEKGSFAWYEKYGWPDEAIEAEVMP